MIDLERGPELAQISCFSAEPYSSNHERKMTANGQDTVHRMRTFTKSDA